MYYRRLRDLREDHDLTQTQLVEILNMHKTTYTNYEQGKREIPFSLAIRLARLYNVSLDFIAGLTDEPQPLKASKKEKGCAAFSRRGKGEGKDENEQL